MGNIWLDHSWQHCVHTFISIPGTFCHVRSVVVQSLAELLSLGRIRQVGIFLYFCDFLKQKTDDSEWRSIFVLVDVPVCIYQSNRPSWGSQSSLSHTTVNSNRCTSSWDCASSFIFIPLPVNSLTRVITPSSNNTVPFTTRLVVFLPSSFYRFFTWCHWRTY